MRVTIVAAVAVLAASLIAPASHGEIVDRVLATVDTEVILLSDVTRELAPMQPMDDAAFETQVRRTLQQAIDNKILYREAVLAGMEVDDSAIDRRVAELREEFPSHEAFLGELEAQGGTLSELRDHIREQLLAHSVARQQRERFERQVSVSEEDVAAFYEQNVQAFRHPERVRVRQIFLAAPEGSDQREAARERLQGMRARVMDGADFADLAREHSEAPGAEEGGIIGWIVSGDLVPALDEAVFALEAGEVSDVVESANGVHLLKVDERQEAGVLELAEVRTEVEPMIRREKREALFEQWMAELRERSRVRTFLQ